MKYFNIDGAIDKDLFNRFLLFCNENGEFDWTIILNTGGGWVTISQTILSIINERKDRVELILQDAYSAGFFIFYEAKCKKLMCRNGRGMIHKQTAEIYINENSKPVYKEDECRIKNWKYSKRDEAKWVNKILTKKELKSYKKGDDIYFTSKRMKEIFPDAEII